MTAKKSRGTLKKLHKIVRTLWLMSCLVGLITQITILSMDYFRYEMVNLIMIEFPIDYQPPSLTICFYNTELIRWSQVDPGLSTRMGFKNMSIAQAIERIKKLGHMEKVQLDTFFTNNTKIGDAMNMTYGFGDIFERCGLISPINYTISFGPCQNFFNMTSYFKDCFKCFSFSLRNQTFVYNYQTLQLVKGIPGFQYAVLMKKNSTISIGEAAIYVHAQGTLPREGFDRWFHVTDLKKLIELTHIEFKNKLLPPPFATNCRDYRRNPVDIESIYTAGRTSQSRAACFENCVRKNSIEDWNLVVPGPLVLNESLRMMSVAYASSRPDVWKNILDTEKECEAFCWRPDCIRTFYAPVKLAATAYDFNVFLTFATQIPSINVNYDQKTTLISYFTSVVSCMGFWVGASVLHVFDLIWNVYMKQFKREQRQDTEVMARQKSSTVRNSKDSEGPKVEERKVRVRSRLDDLGTDYTLRNYDLLLGLNQLRDQIDKKPIIMDSSRLPPLYRTRYVDTGYYG